ncbi:MAG: methyltransferase domain-containing protein [Bacillota bacterium]
MNRKEYLRQQIIGRITNSNWKKLLEQPFFIEKDFGYTADKSEYIKNKECFSKLPDLNNKTVVEIGCNFGMNSFIFASQFPEIKLYAFDIKKKNIEMANLILEYYTACDQYYNIIFYVDDFREVDYADFDWAIISCFGNSYLDTLSKINLLKRKNFHGKIILRYPFWDRNGVKRYSHKYIRKTIDKTLKNFNCELIVNELIIIAT